MRVLLLCDDYYHPGDVPERGLAPLREKGIEFDVNKNAKELDLGNLGDYSVVVISKSDHTSKQDEDPWKTPAMQDAFVKYVENGGGLLVTHSGTVAGKDTGKLDNLIGCKFKFHPAQSLVTVQAIKPHPVTEGVGVFVEKDEHYILDILASDIDILVAAYASALDKEEKPNYDAPGCIAPAGYVRTQGKGRVCVLTPGHNLEVWHNPEYQRLLENGIRWCAGE